MVKNLPVKAGDMGSIPGLGRSPGVENGNPRQLSCLENPMDRGASVGYTLWSCRELGTSEQLTHTHTTYILCFLEIFF